MSYVIWPLILAFLFPSIVNEFQPDNETSSRTEGEKKLIIGIKMGYFQWFSIFTASLGLLLMNDGFCEIIGDFFKRIIIVDYFKYDP